MTIMRNELHRDLLAFKARGSVATGTLVYKLRLIGEWPGATDVGLLWGDGINGYEFSYVGYAPIVMDGDAYGPPTVDGVQSYVRSIVASWVYPALTAPSPLLRLMFVALTAEPVGGGAVELIELLPVPGLKYMENPGDTFETRHLRYALNCEE